MGGWRLPAGGALAAWCLLAVAVGWGGRVPPDLHLGSLPASPRWQALHLPAGGLAPLDPAYVARVLGDVPGAVLGPDSDREQRARTAHGRIASATERIVVDHALTHDHRDGAYEIPGVPFTARTDTREARRDSTDFGDCANSGGTVWYAFRPDRDTRLLASTIGSDYAVALGVYDDAGRWVGCEIDGSGNAEVAFRADGGKRYLFQVTGPVRGGRLVFNLDVLGGAWRLAWTDGAAVTGPTVSADGRRIVFDGYVVDLVSERMTRILGWDGQSVPVWDPEISGDGRFVAFSSDSDRVVRGDTNYYEDVFVYDVATGSTRRVSVSSTGAEGTLPLTTEPLGEDEHELSFQSQAISHDGRYIAFTSALTGLVPDDTAACAKVPPFQGIPPAPGYPRRDLPADVPLLRCRDVFVHDLRTGTTSRISITPSGEGADGDSSTVELSPDGRFVAFASEASNLHPSDDNLYRDVYVHDRDTDGDDVFGEPGAVATELISQGFGGAPGDGNSGPYDWPRNVAMSADGRWVAFVSDATNLVPNDRNGRPDIFVHDRFEGVTTLVTTAYGPLPDNREGSHFDPQIDLSGDGRFLVYDFATSDPDDLSSDTCNLKGYLARNVYLHDRASGSTVLVTLGPEGQSADGASFRPAISGDGRSIVFSSEAANLDPDSGGQCDDGPLGFDPTAIYMYERPTR